MLFCSMAGIEETKQRNLVYLMLKLYKSTWRSGFPRDMGIPVGVCEQMMSRYGKEVAAKIDKERQDILALKGDDIPTANSIVDMAMKKIRDTISTCEDPSKVARTIQILEELDKSSDKLKKEKKDTFLDKYKKKINKDEKD